MPFILSGNCVPWDIIKKLQKVIDTQENHLNSGKNQDEDASLKIFLYNKFSFDSSP